jgi:hypothetical protein
LLIHKLYTSTDKIYAEAQQILFHDNIITIKSLHMKIAENLRTALRLKIEINTTFGNQKLQNTISFLTSHPGLRTLNLNIIMGGMKGC